MIALAPCARTRSAVAIEPIAAPTIIPPRIRPTSPSPRNSRNHKAIRTAPFLTLFTDRTALSRDALDSMFLQAFAGSATQHNPFKPLVIRRNLPPHGDSYEAAR